MDSCDLDMIPMVLAQLNVSLINEANRDKLLRYQRECAKVLRDYWFTRETVDAFLLPAFRTYVMQPHRPLRKLPPGVSL
jgi:hypothetical protein